MRLRGEGLTSRLTRLLRGPVRHGEWSSEVRASPKTSAPGLFRTELKAALLRLSARERLAPPDDSTTSEPRFGHHETILRNHNFLIASDDRIRAGGVGPCPRDQLLGE